MKLFRCIHIGIILSQPIQEYKNVTVCETFLIDPFFNREGVLSYTSCTCSISRLKQQRDAFP